MKKREDSCAGETSGQYIIGVGLLRVVKKRFFNPRLWILTCLFLILIPGLTGQLAEDIGNFRNIQDSGNSKVITADHGYLKISYFSESVARIQIARRNHFDDFSYAVNGLSGKGEFKMSRNNDQVVLSTEKLGIHILMNPLSLVFLNEESDTLNSDLSHHGILFSGDRTTVYKNTREGERFIGLGEKTGPWNKAGRSYTNWNTDSPSYGIYEDPLYSSIPFYIGIHDSLVYGIYVDNSYQTDFNFGAHSENPGFIQTRGGEMDYFFISGNSVEEVVSSYTHITGRMELPPIWSLGLHQSRWSYYPDKEVLNIARTFREKDIPADVMTLDIHYMDDYKLFTWDEDNFPNPRAMISELKSMGFHTTVILDPGIKIEEGYPVYESGLENDVFVMNASGKGYYQDKVWPGWCYFPDFTMEKTRKWWGDQMKDLTEAGVRGFWNDMNEPATWSKTFDPNAIHNFEGNSGTHRRAHNVYGMQMARASYEAARDMTLERPFVLTRAAFAGIQRYSALWTGDNVSSDSHMLLGTRMLNNLGISGVPFCGMDIPGFSGGKELDNELYARFVSIGAFQPYFRIHAAKNTRAGEPWSFGEWVEEIAKKYITLRYKLIPYIYSEFYHASLTGIPVQRSLSIGYEFDPLIYDQTYENQYFFGPSIMVAPAVSTSQFAEVYLPDDGYYDFHTGRFFPEKGVQVVKATNTRPESILPIFVKAGSVLPMQKPVNHLAENPGDTLFLHVYYGEGNSSFVYYEDDGVSYDYTKGEYFRREIVFNGSQRTLSLSEVEGSYTSKFRELKLVFHGFPAELTMLQITNDKTGGKSYPFQPLTIKNESEKIIFHWN